MAVTSDVTPGLGDRYERFHPRAGWPLRAMSPQGWVMVTSDVAPGLGDRYVLSFAPAPSCVPGQPNSVQTIRKVLG